MEKPIIFFILLDLVLILAIYKFRNKRYINYLVFASSFLSILLVTEVVYQFVFKSIDPINKSESIAGNYIKDSLLGYKRSRTGRVPAISTFPNGDTVFKTTYTIIADTSGNYPTYNHRTGFYNPASRKEIVLLGCSFTFGEGVADTSTLAFQLGKKTGISTLNLGCPGYGSHQVYELFLNWYARRSNVDRIFIYSFLSDHFLRANGVYNWNLDGRYLVASNDSLIDMGSLNQSEKVSHRKTAYYLSGFGTFHFIEDNLEKIFLHNRIKDFTEADYTRCMLMLKKMADDISQTGGQLIILNWDKNNWGYRGYDFMQQDKLDKDIQALKNAQVIPVSTIIDFNDPKNFIPADGHPASLAYDRIAEYLSRYIR